MKLQFSGHDSFECRHFWLKKGYDHIKHGNKFNDEAVVPLGAGRNMVTSIRYWMKAYGLLDSKDNLTEFADLIFDQNGFDPYLEDEATIWLLHYQLVTQKYASIYFIIFSELRKQRPEFTKKQLYAFIASQYKVELNDNTFSKDFEAFTKTYIPKNDELEENYAGLFTELNLVSELKKLKDQDKSYVIELQDRNEIPNAIILYCLLEQHQGDSINFENAFSDECSAGTVFAMTRSGLLNKMEEIAKEFELVFSDNSGIRELQFKKGRPHPIDVLKKHFIYVS